MIRRPYLGQRVALHYRPSARLAVGLHLARGVVLCAGTGRGPINVLVDLEDGRLVVIPRGNLSEEVQS